jgi:glycosyltransferase involved in cell wall biosynthesis
LAERYNVFTICLGDGALIPEFKSLSAGFYGPFPGLHDDTTTLEAGLESLFAGRSFRYAIVNSCESRALIGVCKKHGVPTLFLMHEFASYVYHRAQLENALQGASKIVFPADIVAQSSRKVYPALAPHCTRILPQGMCVIPNGNGAHKPLPPALLERLTAVRASGGFVVLGAGSVNLRKGVDLFLSTASKVCRNGLRRPVHFVWVGAGYRPDEDMGYSIYLREQLLRSEIEDCVTFVDEASELNPLYDLTDMFFLASRLDPLPNVTIDAAYRGIPVVCFKDASGMSELMLADPVAAEAVVEHLDTGAAAQYITRLAADDSERVRISEAVRRLAHDNFDMKRYVHQLDALGRAECSSIYSARRRGATA